jgi:hypothetical protein
MTSVERGTVVADQLRECLATSQMLREISEFEEGESWEEEIDRSPIGGGISYHMFMEVEWVKFMRVGERKMLRDGIFFMKMKVK